MAGDTPILGRFRLDERVAVVDEDGMVTSVPHGCIRWIQNTM